MIRRSLLVAAISVALLASPAHAASAPRGQGPGAQALMLAETVNSFVERAQVLNQVCEDASAERRCSPINPALQRAFEAAVDVPITWVAARTPHLGQFWVLAPVRFAGDGAESEFAWRDPGRLGCSGWTRIDWSRERGAWFPTGGVGVVGCPAVP
jgi:hypothetical protein